jgi:dipeptidyl aminopeptidase/acylaminoacyl peptidase
MPRQARPAVLTATFTLLLATPLPASTPAASPSEPAYLGDDTFMEMEEVEAPKISPDGRHVVFTRTWVDQTTDRFHSNLWIVDTAGERVRELTHGDWSDGGPVFSPDGTRLAFLSDRGGSEQVHVLWLDTREVAQLTRLEHTPQDLRWSPDGKRLAFTLFVPDETPPLKIELPKGPKGAERAAPAVVVDRMAWARDGRGYLPPGYRHVFVVDAVLGGTPRQVTDGPYHHDDADFSRDGTLYFSAIRKEDAEYLRRDTEIYAADPASGEIRVLTDRKGPDDAPLVSPDGRWIAYTGYDDKLWTSHLDGIYLMDAGGGAKRALATDLASSPRRVTWAPDSSGVYFLLGEEGSYNLHFASFAGEVRAVTTGTQVLSDFSLSAGGRAAAVRSGFHEPEHLVTFDVAAPGATTTLVDVNADVLGDVRLGEVEEIWATAPDGWKSQGWLIRPADFDPAKKYPMVLWIHGGPWSMYSVGFNWSFQNFAASGYALLYMNPRGSTGYGQDFVNGIQHAYPGKDYDDLMAGVDEAVRREWIDEENLFVCGGSGGGVLTAWIVGHTDRFRAAASMRPVINWHSFVGTTDGVMWYDQFRKRPWEDPAEYAARSPLTYAPNVTTPTLVMTGEADLRTPMSQSEEYYRALKMLKKETLLIRMPEEYHGWRRPSHRLAQQLYLRAWFGKYRTDLEDEGDVPEVKRGDTRPGASRPLLPKSAGGRNGVKPDATRPPAGRDGR